MAENSLLCVIELGPPCLLPYAQREKSAPHNYYFGYNQVMFQTVTIIIILSLDIMSTNQSQLDLEGTLFNTKKLQMTLLHPASV